MNGIPDEVFQVGFALHQEVIANPGEFVCPVFRHFQSELLHVLFVYEQGSSSSAGLYLSWDRTHSCCCTSIRGPK